MIRVIVFGMGVLYNMIKDTWDLDKIEILGYTDSYAKKKGIFFEERPVIPMESLTDYPFDYILVTSSAYDTIKDQLLSVGIAEEKIVGCCIVQSNFYNEYAEKINCDIKKYMKYHVLESIMKDGNSNIELTYLCNMIMLGRTREIPINYEDDYVRLSTFELVAHKIKEESIQGAVAELGVYRGEFARHINRIFPDRIFYLFDTFEGFHKADIDIEMKKINNMKFNVNSFIDTNVEMVLQRMIKPEKCIIKRGYFPESIDGLEDIFAFVSIDADLYQPIYEGLTYFYPRLAKGGYIFVHDFNNASFPGAKKAVEQYCRENNLSYFPMSDREGSAAITK